MIALCLTTKTRIDAETEALIPTTGGVFDVAPIGIEIGPSGGREVDVNPTLDARAKDGPVRNQLAGAVMQSMQVRRLTPTECERLQGFPDGYTNIPWRGKPESPDGPRYKALGNSWAVPCVRWIGKRIAEAA